MEQQLLDFAPNHHEDAKGREEGGKEGIDDYQLPSDERGLTAVFLPRILSVIYS